MFQELYQMLHLDVFPPFFNFFHHKKTQKTFAGIKIISNFALSKNKQFISNYTKT